jgi:mannosylglycoprotein endo-beta-mannosidase
VDDVNMRRLLAALAVAGAAATEVVLRSPGVAWTFRRGADGVEAPAIIPGTSLINLIANGTWPSVTDPFVDDLLNSTIPDISVTGKDFWALTYSAVVTPPPATPSRIASPHTSLLVKGQSYRTTLSVNGTVVPPLGAPSGTVEAVGMFQRFVFDLGPLVVSSPLSLSLTVLPPDNPGSSSNSCPGCGQGGDHLGAQDVISQDTAGWDWVGGTPDRNTGLFDDVLLRVTGPVLVRDPIAATLTLEQAPGALPDDPANVTAAVTVSLLCLDPASPVTGTLLLSIPELGPAASISLPITVAAGGDGVWHDVTLPTLDLQNVGLWWPHTVGTPRLYNASVSFVVDGDTAASDAVSWGVGFRTATAAVDASLGGQVFSVNGRRLFLQGGNFIQSDQFNRYNNDPVRYYRELRLHREAGLNLIRLWAGAGAHGSSLYSAADELGVLVMQEFFMSGDENGRWAGSYDWPLDHALYMRAVADVIRVVRGHPSVLFFCGGNELWPQSRSPPPDIAAQLPDFIAALDPSGRFYIPSSMSDFPPDFDPSYALAPKDGPYGMLDEREFGERNPGMFLPGGGRADEVLIAFQPELGSTSNPDYESMLRFLTPRALAAFPPANAPWNAVDNVWVYHRFLPWVNDKGVDTLYAYGPAANASEYALRAALAQYRQTQALYEGFAGNMWTFYGAMIMWKTQGPWPCFRGALYDSYLAATGSFWGVRAATGGAGPASGPHPQLEQKSGQLLVVNRGFVDVPGPLTLTVTAYDVTTGEQLLSPPLAQVLVDGVAANSVATLPLPLAWPSAAAAGSTLLVRLTLTTTGAGPLANATLAPSDYWLSTLSANLSVPNTYPALAALRAGTAGATVPLNVTAAQGQNPVPGDGGLSVLVTLSSPPTSASVAFGVRVTLRYKNGTAAHARLAARSAADAGVVDDRVLPQYLSANLFALVPGEVRVVTVAVDRFAVADGVGFGDVVVEVEGWNVPRVSVGVGGG